MDGLQRGGGDAPPASLRYKIRLDNGRLPGAIVLHHGLSVSLLSRLPFDREARIAGFVWNLLCPGRHNRSEVDRTFCAGNLRSGLLRGALFYGSAAVYGPGRPSNAGGSIFSKRLSAVHFETAHAGAYRVDCVSVRAGREY